MRPGHLPPVACHVTHPSGLVATGVQPGGEVQAEIRKDNRLSQQNTNAMQ